MKFLRSEKQLLYLFLAMLVIVQVFLMLKNENVFEGTDNVTHYQIARYAFKYPHLFLDSWGKPVFTTLVAPFSQLGFHGAQMFNLAVAVLTLLLVFRLSNHIFKGGAIFTVVLTAFAPVYFLLMITCLTEVLFSFFLVAAVYLFAKNRLLLSAVALSFIPFVRTEGIVLFPVFMAAFLLKRNWPAIPFLLTGTLFYSVVGFFAFGDFLWIIHRFPYPTGESVYGSGELLHFVKKSNTIFGIPLILLIIDGLYFWLKEILKKFELKSETVILFILVAGSWITYFAAHSYVWWKGVGGSLGLTRVIGAVIPLAALTGVKAFQPLLGKEVNRKKGIIVLSALTVAQVVLFFQQTRLPFKNGPVEKLITGAAEYVRQNFDDKKVYYFNPEFSFKMNRDPYDQTRCNWGIGDKLQPSNSMETGAILIWDAHFGPNEGRVSLEAVEKDPYLQKIKTFLPLEKVTVLGGYDYAIHIFEKVVKRNESVESDVFTKNLDLNPETSSQVISLAGENVLEIEKGYEYSPNIVIYTDELAGKSVFEGELTVEFQSDEVIAEKDVLLVFSVENGKESLHYAAVPMVWNGGDSGWKQTKLATRFPAGVPAGTLIKMYIWNKNHKHIYVKSLNSRIVSY